MPWRRILTRVCGALVAFALVTTAATPTSRAQDVASLVRDLQTGADFRLRVGAALSLGKTHSLAALEPLVRALEDSHPAVRTAAAAALGVLGNPNAIPALRARMATESSPAVKSQMATAIEAIKNGGAASGASHGAAKMLVMLGHMKNASGVRGTQLADVLRGATRARAAQLPGVEVLAEASDGPREAASRKLPLVVLDGVVNRLAQGAHGANVTVSAQVEYVVRKMPEQALKGTVTGAAQAIGQSAPRDRSRVQKLEEQAIAGAVESAMRGAPPVLAQAVR